MSYSSLSDNRMFQIFSFFYLNDYMELFKTVSAYSWLFIYFRKSEIYVIYYKIIRKIVKTTFGVFVIKGFTV